MSSNGTLPAFHEAAHAVLAHQSFYHGLIGDISVTSPETGQTFVILSKSKLRAAGKNVDAEVMKDPEVLTEAALIYLAGYAAELHFLKLNPSSSLPDKSLSQNDYTYVSQYLDEESVTKMEAAALELVAWHWPTIRSIAEKLLRDGVLESVEVTAFLDRAYPSA